MDLEKINFSKLIKFVCAGFILLILLLSSFYTIEPGQVGFTKTFGKINQDIKESGLHFKIPFVSNTIKMNIRNIEITSNESSSSKDAQEIFTEISVNYSLNRGSVIDLYSNIGTEKIIEEKIINKVVKESIKSSTAKFNAMEMINKRSEVSKLIRKNIEEKLENKGLTINDVNILNFSFSKQFAQAIEDKVSAEQNALKEKANVEKVKFEAQQKIERAKGEALRIQIQAKAEAEKIRIQAQAIMKQGGAEYVKLQEIKKWDGVLPKYMLGNGTNTLFKIQ